MLRPHLSGPAAVALVALAAACGGTEETPAPAPATYAAVQAVLTRACAFSSCHFTVARAGAGLRLGEADAYAALVRAPSTQVPRLMRVQPGDPAASWLMHKIDNTLSAVAECRAAGNTCGASMPERSELLPAAERDLIRRWIAAGAPGPTP